MAEKYEIVYPVSVLNNRYLLDSGIEKNGASHGNVLAADCGPYPQCTIRLAAIADALNRIPQLEAEAAEWKRSANRGVESLARNVEQMESLRMRNVELEAEVDRLQEQCARLKNDVTHWQGMAQKLTADKMESELLRVINPGVTVDSPVLPEPITRRDLFAAAALAGRIAQDGLAAADDGESATRFRENDAIRCLKMADAMLAEAKKGGA